MARVLFLLDNLTSEGRDFRVVGRSLLDLLQGCRELEFSVHEFVQYAGNIEHYHEFIATYFQALKAILDTPLTMAGIVLTIYFTIPSLGCYEIKPHHAILTTENAFARMMGELLTTERVLVAGTDDIILCKIPSTRDIIGTLPAGCRKIGCVSGPGSRARVVFSDYINAANNNQTFFIVVGEFAGGDIDAHIDEYVKVSSLELEPHTCLHRVVGGLERKLMGCW